MTRSLTLMQLMTALALALVACGPDLESGGAWEQDATTAQPLTAPLTATRSAHTATLLADGRVLVVGGMRRLGTFPIPTSEPVASAELYDPTTDTWSATSPLAEARYSHTATLLADGRVLVVGGQGN
ncbi:kelch repeat-containing protein, partial [Pyxidicoccus sp. 3LG]